MWKRASWLLAGLTLGAPAMGGFKPDFGAMMKDLELVSKTEDHMTLLVWLPSDFWRAALQTQSNLTPQAVDRFLKALDPYSLFAVVDGESEIAGAMTFTDAETLRKSVTIEDRKGVRLSPMQEDSISAGVRNLMQMMHPGLANMLGPMGAHMELFAFPSVGQDGERLTEATKEGSLVVHVGGTTFRYRLPLGSLLPPMIDRKTGDSFPGNYRFNPFTGDKLSAVPADATAPAASGTPRTN